MVSTAMSRIKVSVQGHLKELTFFQQRGRLIQDNCKEVCDAILNKVEEFYALTDLPLPFICVEGSSGMGISQLAFALQGRRPYFYWLATPIGVDSQQIYKNFASISRRFDYFVGLDDQRTKREDAILNSMPSIYADGELWTYGFIRALLDYSNSGNLANGSMIHFINETPLNVPKCKLQDVRTTIADMKSKNKKLPFLYWMKCLQARTSPAERTWLLFKGIFLVLWSRGIYYGNRLNLIAQAGGSYAKEHRWMAILPRFPPYQFVLDVAEKQDWDDVISRYPVIEYIVNQSRGRFARHFTEQVLQIVEKQRNVKLNELLDNAFAAIHQSILFRKKNFDGKYAQLMAISFTNFHQPATKKPRSEVGSSSMHAHFANLVDECLSDIYLSTGRLHKVTQEGMLVPSN
ncbi:Aste57867_11264 [Aphanomyces stellatus]|uniref:Aste57867_11264 protein n=1 Tax=Aphanomyces stellatus TaxID=120398 RepID=A0A485KSF2_9STRA|nr:hypothetical protein As57867_011222 [Aphanomyces stellatus]VFT88127.1 Aste57867_11264 [Aphanomyces stellatus]